MGDWIGVLNAKCPRAFNGFNDFSFAYLERSDKLKAIDAFTSAIAQHPDVKAGYIDLAHAHFEAGNNDLALKYLRKAVDVDVTAKREIYDDNRFKPLSRAL